MSASQLDTLNLVVLTSPRPMTGTTSRARVGVAVAEGEVVVVRCEKASHGSVPYGTSNTV